MMMLKYLVVEVKAVIQWMMMMMTITMMMMKIAMTIVMMIVAVITYLCDYTYSNFYQVTCHY